VGTGKNKITRMIQFEQNLNMLFELSTKWHNSTTFSKLINLWRKGVNSTYIVTNKVKTFKNTTLE